MSKLSGASLLVETKKFSSSGSKSEKSTEWASWERSKEWASRGVDLDLRS